MMYNSTVNDCFFAPRHVGTLELNHDFVVVFKNKQKDQGIIEFYMQCGQDRLIHKLRFKTNGNPYLIAGLEWLCRQLEGQALDEVALINYQVLINELDIPVPQYPLALRIVQVFKESLILMNNRLLDAEQHP
jgi:nitrogen fixation protein NifU and related proteins